MRRADVSATLVKEVCRLYPSAWWFSREVMQPVAIGGREAQARHLAVDLPMAAAARIPGTGESPDKFLMHLAPYDRRLSVPFGAGPRACAGMGLPCSNCSCSRWRWQPPIASPALHRTQRSWPKASVTLDLRRPCRSTSSCGRAAAQHAGLRGGAGAALRAAVQRGCRSAATPVVMNA